MMMNNFVLDFTDHAVNRFVDDFINVDSIEFMLILQCRYFVLDFIDDALNRFVEHQILTSFK